MRNSRLHNFPLLHYMLLGERRGFRPNAFFDPRHFCKASCGRGLGFYLKDRQSWALSPSESFDTDFYKSQDGCSWDGLSAPLITFWERDFDLGVNPSASFDTNFVKRACCVNAFDKRAAVFELLSSGKSGVTKGEELSERRQSYLKSIEVRELRRIDRPRHRDLLFIQCTPTYRTDLLREDRGYDVLLNYYDQVTTAAHEAEHVFSQPGTKSTAISKLLAMPASVLLDYEQVLFMDDDVVISAEALTSFFDKMREAELDLAQPSLSETSSTWYVDLKQPRVGRGMRPVTSVEIMMPALSRRLLAQAGWVFEEAVSGWGVDLLLGLECRKRFQTSPMVIGDVVAEHLREVDEEHGSFYRFVKSLGFDASVEAGAIACKFNVDDYPFSAVRFVH